MVFKKLSIIFLVFLLSIQVKAAKLLKETVINGFPVLIYDVESGEEFMVAYNVPFGSQSDTVEQSGLAHFFEHIMGKGSLKFPGHGRLNEESGLISASRNASTSDHWTLYYMSAHQQNAERALELLGAGLSGLEFNPETFSREKQVVINEIVEQGMKVDLRIVRSLGPYLLLPDGHPFKKHRAGDLSTLEKMSLDDHKLYYYSDYIPENVRIAVAGNFKDGTLNLELVEQWMNSSFKPADITKDPSSYKLPDNADEISAKNRRFPSLVSGQSFENVAYLSSAKHGKENWLNLLFDLGEIDVTKGYDKLAYDIVESYIFLNFPGSFIYEIQHEKHWITKQSFSDTLNVNNRLLMEMQWQLTAEGYQNRWKILQSLNQLLADIEKFGIPEDALKHITDSVLYSLEKQSKRAGSIVRLSLNNAFNPMNEEIRRLKFKETIAQITQDRIKAAVSSISIKNALLSMMSPKVEAEEVDVQTGRQYKIQNESAEISELIKIREEKQQNVARYKAIIRKIDDLIFSEEVLKGRESPLTLIELVGEKSRPELQLWFEESHKETDSALSLTLDFKVNPEQQAVLMSRLIIFNNLFRSELSYLYSKGISASVSHGSSVNKIVVQVSGNSSASLDALSWLTHQFVSFAFTRKNLEEFLKVAEDEHISSENSAHAGIQAARRIFPMLNAQIVPKSELFKLAKVISFSQHKELFHSMLRVGASRSLVAVGDYHDVELKDLLKRALPLSLVPLSAKPILNQYSNPLRNESHIMAWSSNAGESNENYGVAKSYRGPSLEDVRESVAVLLLGNLLQTRVSEVNRSQRQLGYVHGAQAIANDFGFQDIFFYGQNAEPNNITVLLDGWKSVLNEIKNKTFTSEEKYLKVRATLIERLNQKASTIESKLESYADTLATYGNPYYETLQARELLHISLDDFYEIAIKYLINNHRFAQHIVSSAASRDALCQAVLVSEAAKD